MQRKNSAARRIQREIEPINVAMMNLNHLSAVQGESKVAGVQSSPGEHVNNDAEQAEKPCVCVCVCVYVCVRYIERRIAVQFSNSSIESVRKVMGYPLWGHPILP